VFWFDWQVSPILPQSEDSFHRLTFFEPRDYRVVFGIQIIAYGKSIPQALLLLY